MMIGSKLGISGDLVFKQTVNESICFACAPLNQLLLTNPQTVDEAARQLALEGRAKLGGLNLQSDSRLQKWARDFCGRWGLSFERALLLLTLAEEMNGSLQLFLDDKGHFGSLDPTTRAVIYGGRMEWVFNTGRKINGGSLYLREKSGKEGFRAVLESPRAKGTLISLVWDEISQSRHLLTVDKVEAGRIYLLDSIETSSGYFNSLFKSARVEGANIWSVSLAELIESNRIRYLIAERGLHQSGVTSLSQLKPLEVEVKGLEYFVLLDWMWMRKTQEKAVNYLNPKKRYKKLNDASHNVPRGET